MKKEKPKDNIDKYIETVVNKKISEPQGFEKAIKEALYTEKFDKRLRRVKIVRTISTACATVIITSGVTIGGYVAYEKVWKEPKQYTYQELQGTIADTQVSEEEKKELISEEQAKQTALEIAKNLGYENEKIESIELKQNKEEGYESTYYLINTNNSNKDNLNMRVDAKTGELVALENRDILSSQNNITAISEIEAEEISNSIFEKITNEQYIFKECKEENVVYDKQNAEVWIAKYYKEYNKIVNPYEELSIEFYKSTDRIEVSSIIKSSNGVYENNSQVISEQEAIDIATNKEKELTNSEIIDTNAEIGIRKLNNYLYELEKINNINQEKDGEILKNEDIARNVWVISIKHPKNTYNNLEDYIKSKNKQYFVDMTTGEIIGGKMLQNE